MLTFGIEEEFVFLDRELLRPVHVSADVQSDLAAWDFQGSTVHSEFLSSQLEYVSPVLTKFEEAASSLWTFRKALLACAEIRGVLVAGVGTPFANPSETVVTPNDRYREIANTIGALTSEHQINGLHIHVGIPDREAGVVALNYVRQWLPTLLAVSANSPFWAGHDTGFSSWRAIQYRRWTTAGCPPLFADAADYDSRTNSLIGVGATADQGSISWSARLSAHQPTLEIRVADAQLEPSSTLLLVLLGRALVATALDRQDPMSANPEPELLDSAMWHAARHGISGGLVHPGQSKLAPAAEVLQALLDEVHAALQATNDLDIVTALAEQLFMVGTGSDRQRMAFATGGKRGLAGFLDNAISTASSACQPAAGVVGPTSVMPLVPSTPG